MESGDADRSRQSTEQPEVRSTRGPSPVRPAWGAIPGWTQRWRESGRLVLLLDFDGTLAPIVDRPELAALPEPTREAILRLASTPGVEVALVSGRGLEDVRSRAGLGPLLYAGNHGMEIHGPGVDQVHPEAAAARPSLDEIIRELRPRLADIPGALLEDKGLTLSVHFRMVAGERVPEVERIVRVAAEARPGIRLTEGKCVLEVRPRVEWDKGRAVAFLLRHLAPPAGAPVLYLGDDTTDEDAFRAVALYGGDGVIVADPPASTTTARWFLTSPAEVGRFLQEFSHSAP